MQRSVSTRDGIASTSLASDNYIQASEPTMSFNLTAHLKLDYNGHPQAADTSRMLRGICAEDIANREVVQQCTVVGHGNLANWTEVTEALPCLPNLQDLFWEGIAPMPGMKEFMQTRLPECRLHLDMTPKFDMYTRERLGEASFSSLAGTAGMVSLKAHIEYGPDPEPHRIGFVHQLLATCPNIRSFDLAFDHHGCIVSDGQPRAFNFESGEFAGVGLPSLQELRLSWYDFEGPTHGQRRWTRRFFRPDDLPWPFSRLTPEQMHHYLPPPLRFWLEEVKEWLYSDDRPAWLVRSYERLTGDRASPPTISECESPCCDPPINETTNLDDWLDRMSFTNITTLELDTLDDTAASRLFPTLHSLTSLNIHYTDDCSVKALFSYLQNPHNPLTALHLGHIPLPNNTLTFLLTTLESNHSTLKTLTLPSTPNPSPEDLTTLTTALPNLTALTIRQPRTLHLLSNHTSPTHFPALESLTIQVPTPGGLYDTRNDPLFNASALERQFLDFLCSPNNTNTGSIDSNTTGTTTAHIPNLQRLELLIGCWERRSENSMFGPPKEVVGRYVCERTAATGTEAVAVECNGGLRVPGYYSGRPLLVEGPRGNEVLGMGEVGRGGRGDDFWDLGPMPELWVDDEDEDGFEAREAQIELGPEPGPEMEEVDWDILDDEELAELQRLREEMRI